MSEKPETKRRRREFNVERDRKAMPFLWGFGYVALGVGLIMLVAGLFWNLQGFLPSSVMILAAASIVLRIAFQGRQQIKEIDAQKNAEPPVE